MCQKVAKSYSKKLPVRLLKFIIFKIKKHPWDAAVILFVIFAVLYFFFFSLTTKRAMNAAITPNGGVCDNETLKRLMTKHGTPYAEITDRGDFVFYRDGRRIVVKL